jgi:hypothetical protein
VTWSKEGRGRLEVRPGDAEPVDVDDCTGGGTCVHAGAMEHGELVDDDPLRLERWDGLDLGARTTPGRHHQRSRKDGDFDVLPAVRGDDGPQAGIDCINRIAGGHRDPELDEQFAERRDQFVVVGVGVVIGSNAVSPRPSLRRRPRGLSPEAASCGTS